MSAIPPGWYKDPADPATQRWWDGEGWLGEPIPADATPPPGPPPVPAPQPAAPVAGPAAVAPHTPAPEAHGPDAHGFGGAHGPGAHGPGAHGPGTPWPGGPFPGAGAPGAATPPPWPMSHRYPVPSPRPHGFPLAGVGARFMARLVDALIVLALAAVANIWFAIEFWRNMRPVLDWAMSQPATMDSVPATADRAFELLTLMAIVLTAVWFAYEVPASANTGQTLGKRIFGIRIVREEEDGRLGFGRSFRRWFRMAWPTPFWAACCGLSAIWQIVDCLFVAADRQAHQALHDRITRTFVVQVPQPGQVPAGPSGRPGTPAAPGTPGAPGGAGTPGHTDFIGRHHYIGRLPC